MNGTLDIKKAKVEFSDSDAYRMMRFASIIKNNMYLFSLGCIQGELILENGDSAQTHHEFLGLTLKYTGNVASFSLSHEGLGSLHQYFQRAKGAIEKGMDFDIDPNALAIGNFLVENKRKIIQDIKPTSTKDAAEEAEV